MSINIFLSYCWKDTKYADDIEQHYENSEIVIHRDKNDIHHWGSIEKFMKSIRNADFAILIISDNYLKSENCMYEALQVMKEEDYSTKIFPLVIDDNIYRYGGSIDYIKYWEDKFDDLKSRRQYIQHEHASDIDNQLKIINEISSNISCFIKTVSDMNNPQVKNIFEAINVTLQERGFINGSRAVRNNNSAINYFEKIGISNNVRKIFTDRDKKKFLQESYGTIIDIVKLLKNHMI